MEQVVQPHNTLLSKITQDSDDRRHEERRKKYSEGYTYLSMVGWYCRRERTRRKGDSFE